MTVKTPHGDFEIRELSFKDRRELHRLEVKSFKDGELDIEKYYAG